MSTFTIGRVSLADVQTWDYDGEEVSLSSQFIGSSVHEAKAWRMQLLGLASNPDERIVPVTCSDDPDIDGFYLVQGVSVPSNPVALVAFTFQYSVSLLRVPSYGLPWTNSVLLGAVRTNSHSITDAASGSAYFHGVPNDALDYGGSGFGFAPTTVVTATGTLRIIDIAASQITGRVTSRYTIKPADWYDCAATIEYQRNNTYYTVVGRQIETGLSSAGWRLSNGLVRVTGASNGQLSLSWYTDPAGWSTAKVFTIRDDTPTAFDTFTSLNVLRNDPACVSIRLGVRIAADAVSDTTLDLTLRRGSVAVDGLATWLGQSLDLGAVGRAAVETSANITIGGATVGIKANADDADSNKFWIVSERAVTTDTTNGKITLTSDSATMPFSIGADVGGQTTTTGPSKYFFPFTERIAVVNR